MNNKDAEQKDEVTAEVGKEEPKGKKEAAKKHPAKPFPIAGIGASAGGLEALELFLRHLPPKTGMAFVVVQHLDPSHKGMMPELLQRVTTMKVLQVRDRMKVQADCIYVIPPNKDISLLRGVLHLLEPTAPRGLRLPIDFFFRSLAEDRKEQSIGVIFSGMGSDGTLGLRSIKEKGGLVVVQDPGSAKFSSMPKHALDTGLVDLVAPVEELPQKILDCIRNFPKCLPMGPILEPVTQSFIEKIMILLREKTGQDFSVYKKNTMYRRIERRMSLHQILHISHYAEYLRKNPHELELLFKELLIGVTSFFRDPQVWETLKKEVLVPMIRESHFGTTLRAWVTGCSTGEEAYSLGIVFTEAMELAGVDDNQVSMQIFATDLDNVAIEKARLGFYSPNIAADVSGERLRRFFIREEDGYRVGKSIREMVIFATQNLVMDPPFTKLHLISCRNLLIYLKPDTQKKLIPLFHYSLNPNGILFLGNAETIGSLTDFFSPIGGEGRIYLRLPAPLPIRAVEFPVALGTVRTDMTKGTNLTTLAPPPNLQVLAEQLVLQRFSPASVLVNEKGDIFFISGRTGKYLEPAAGRANWNIFAMSREGLLGHLTGVFQKAVREKGTSTLRDVEVKHEGGVQTVDVTVQYLHEPLELEGMLMVIISEAPSVAKPRRRGKSASGMTPTELEAELQHTRKELQLAQQDMQTSLEELKASNEELQSTNEELQSTNEELTTSKEELQSLNEELQTVNAEQTAKVEELSRANNDMKNLLNSTEVATIFLDNDLHVRRYTSGSTKIFRLRPSDVDRPLSEIVTDLAHEDISGDAADVLHTLMFSEKEITTHDGRWFRVRVKPYRTVEDKIEGVVITLVEITWAKNLERQLRSAQLELLSLVRSAPAAIIALSQDGSVVEFNDEAEKVHGRTREQVTGQNYFDLFVPEKLRRQAAEEMLQAISGDADLKVETVIAVGEDERVLGWKVNPKRDPKGIITGIVAVAIDSNVSSQGTS